MNFESHLVSLLYKFVLYPEKIELGRAIIIYSARQSLLGSQVDINSGSEWSHLIFTIRT